MRYRHSVVLIIPFFVCCSNAMKFLISHALLCVCVVFSECQDENEGIPCRDLKEEFCTKQRVICHIKRFKTWAKHYCKLTCGYCKAGSTEAPPLVSQPPYHGKCGQPEVKGTRVIAGTTPPRGAWPWQVLLSYDGFPMCGGTLIAPQWVVTAAHCVYGKERDPWLFSVRVGEHDRQVEEGSEVDVDVRKIFRHRQYSSRKMQNDIAVLKLYKPVKLNKYVQPACLPTTDPPVGTKCYITGWGKTHHPGHMTQILQQGVLPVVSNKVCYAKNKEWIGIKVTSDMICAGSGGTDRVSGCHGDSGGPFVCHLNGRWELHGSVSYGSGTCRSSETYTVFSRTTYFKKWIQNIVITK